MHMVFIMWNFHIADIKGNQMKLFDYDLAKFIFYICKNYGESALYCFVPYHVMLPIFRHSPIASETTLRNMGK